MFNEPAQHRISPYALRCALHLQRLGKGPHGALATPHGGVVRPVEVLKHGQR